MNLSQIDMLVFFAAILGAVGMTAIYNSLSFKQNLGKLFDVALPGVDMFDANLLDAFEKTKATRGEDYHPRTKHLQPGGWAKYTNRLFMETSPYLLQHAHNPVNWYPWGDEAFETARKLNRPVLLSVGYSTCHWCHVMEEESFEDEEVARYLNQNYIAVKVDREERPDIDAVYMSAVQAITGGGGWPMTVWLTPDRVPFYGGTYFPARNGDRGAATGFLTILERIQAVYHSRQDHVQAIAENLTRVIQQILEPKTGHRLPGSDLMKQAAEYYKKVFDPVYGGMSGAPKFPSSLPVRFLLRYYRRMGDENILHMARRTLEKMAAGGIYDQVGGGFHRYSVDSQWLVPHFEKMLYDNALLVMAYLEGYQVTADENFRRVVIEVLNYIERDMTSPEGAFYSATDADSLTPQGHREEGYYFTWTPEELVEVLGRDRAEIVQTYYAVSSGGNFEGRNILHTPETDDQVAGDLKISKDHLQVVIEEARELLYRKRNLRSLPLRDEKILAAWNGLMISAHARAGLVLGDSRYTERAARAADFILSKLFVDNRLYRSYKDQQTGHLAYLDDYAFLIAALLDLYEAAHDIRWLKKALALDELLRTYYEDEQNGGFFMTGREHENLIAREKPNYDGAEPSGNSVAVLNLLRLGEYTLNDGYRVRAQKALKAFLGDPAFNPLALSEMLLALDFHLDKPKEVVIVAPKDRQDELEPFLVEFRKQFLPNRILVVAAEGEGIDSQARHIPIVGGKFAIEGKATAYVCEKGVCKLPAQDPATFAQQLKSVEKYRVG